MFFNMILQAIENTSVFKMLRKFTLRRQPEYISGRRTERVEVNVEVMLKKSSNNEASPSGANIQWLKDAQMTNFSRSGAQLLLSSEIPIHRKDQIDLIYQNRDGQWITMESNVRWVSCSEQDSRWIGVEFN